jgi:hypothetical protein
VGGGYYNGASGLFSTISGGRENEIGLASCATIGGGNSNNATGTEATIAGGRANRARGVLSSVPGGSNNEADGDYSFAAGRRAKAAHAGAFVWGDSQDVDKPSSAADEFSVYAEGGMRVFAEGVAAPSLAIDSLGGVGIGTSTPAFTLEVNGSAGKPGGGAWSVASDRRLKKNIHDLEGALQTLLALRGVTFEYEDPEAVHELPGERIGFIAQEVEEVLPDWVEESGGYKRLTVRGFEALAVEALRQQQGEMAGLAAENESLSAELEALRSKLAALEVDLAALAAR